MVPAISLTDLEVQVERSASTCVELYVWHSGFPSQYQLNSKVKQGQVQGHRSGKTVTVVDATSSEEGLLG